MTESLTMNLSFPPVPNEGEGHADWEYVMRRDMQEITPGLYLGPYAAATKSNVYQYQMRGFQAYVFWNVLRTVEWRTACADLLMLCVLEKSGVTHIVCIRHAIEAHLVKPNFVNKFQYLVINISDSVTENIIQHFPKVKSFLDGCFEVGGRALVHGNAGISRSAALVIAYLMEKHGLCYRDAFSYVQQRRFCINPNEGFAHQLTEYEPIYRARLSLQSGERSVESGLLKRKVRDDKDEDDSVMMDF